jgi:hypothetical protein
MGFKILIMQKIIVLTFFMIITNVMSQAKKPTLMIVPSDVWCYENNYQKTYENQGMDVRIPDYAKAFSTNSDLKQIISLINGLMAKDGFKLKNMESVLKIIEEENVIKVVTTSKQSSSFIEESPQDQILRVARADIIIELTWSIIEKGPRKEVNFNLQGIDAYTGKQIATATGIGNPSISNNIVLLVSEAVINGIDLFKKSLQLYFDDLFKEGREVIIKVQKWQTSDWNLETIVAEEELGFIIEDWLFENTVKGRFNTSLITDSMAVFEQVRIPVLDEKERPLDTRRFARGLSRFLSKEPYNIPNKLVTKGLGEVTIILGEK